jgi:hypothetical protein
MAKTPETLQMEYAVEHMAASRRKQFWTKDDVIRYFLRRNDRKRFELKRLLDLDNEIHERFAGELEMSLPHRVYHDRELQRLTGLASRLMRQWKEEEYGLHRRFGAWPADLLEGGREWRWFEVRYALTSYLELWQDLKRKQHVQDGLTIAETQLILDVAHAQHANSINSVYAEAMQQIKEMRS